MKNLFGQRQKRQFAAADIKSRGSKVEQTCIRLGPQYTRPANLNLPNASHGIHRRQYGIVRRFRSDGRSSREQQGSSVRAQLRLGIVQAPCHKRSATGMIKAHRHHRGIVRFLFGTIRCRVIKFRDGNI